MQETIFFKMGSSLEDLQLLNMQHGTIYFISETGEMFWDLVENDKQSRKKIVNQNCLVHDTTGFCSIDFDAPSSHLDILILGKTLLGNDGGKGEIIS